MKKHWWETGPAYYLRIQRNFYKWIENYNNHTHAVRYEVAKIFEIFNKKFPAEEIDTIVFLDYRIPFTVTFVGYIDDLIAGRLEEDAEKLLKLGIVSLLIAYESTDVRYGYIKSAIIIPYFELFNSITEERLIDPKFEAREKTVFKRYVFEDKIKEFYKQRIKSE